MNVVAVPVKDLVNAKQRLVRALSPPERMALARAMLHDVLRALVGAPLDARWLITRDPEVTATARILPASISGSAAARLVKLMVTAPVATSATAGAAPR